MSKDSIVLGTMLLMVVLGTTIFLAYPRHDIPALQTPDASTSVKGLIEKISDTDKNITVYTAKGLHVAVAFDDKTVIRNANGAIAEYSILQTGMDVTTIGIAQNSYSMTAQSVFISPGGVDTRAVQPDNLFQDSIVPNTYSITGMAIGGWFSEGSFPVLVYDSRGVLLDRAHAYAQNEWRVPGLVPFNAWLSFDDPTTATGTVVFVKNNADVSLPAEKIIVPIKFATQAGTTAVKLYYPNSRKATEIADVCSIQTLLPVRRNIPDTESPIRDTMNELIKGMLSHEEKAQGFTTDFPDPNFKLISSSLADNGTLTLEFSSVPGFTSGGSCKMGLLSEEIRKTALQFSSVKKVVFKPDELFQP